MKKYAKLLALTLCVFMLAGMLGACAKEDDALAQIRKKGYITWGTNAAFTPFEYIAGNAVTGVDAEIGQAIAEHIGVELKVEDMEFESLPAALEAGTIDYIAAGYTVTAERQQTMDFSLSYWTAVQVVLVNEDSDIATEDDFQGKTVGVQMGTTGDLFVATPMEEEGLITVARYDNMLLAAQDMQNGRVDMVIGDDLPISLIMNSLGGMKLVDVSPFEDEMYAFAVKKGQEGLLNAIDEVLFELIESGQIEEFIKSHS